MNRPARAICLLLLGGAAIGCGGTNTIAPTVPSASPSATPTANGTGAPCRTADLEIALTNSVAAGGTAGGYLMFTNTTDASCTLQGAPGLSGVTAQGQTVQARVSNAIGIQFPAEASPMGLTLLPGQSAFAGYGGPDAPPSGSSCPPPFHIFRAAAPGDASTVELPAFNKWLGQDQPSCGGLEVTTIVAAADMDFLQPLRP